MRGVRDVRSLGRIKLKIRLVKNFLFLFLLISWMVTFERQRRLRVFVHTTS